MPQVWFNSIRQDAFMVVSRGIHTGCTLRGQYGSGYLPVQDMERVLVPAGNGLHVDHHLHGDIQVA